MSEDEGQETLELTPSLKARAALTLGALGIVFGDIGTSPIYTMQTVFNPEDPHPVSVTPDHVYGIAPTTTSAVAGRTTLGSAPQRDGSGARSPCEPPPSTPGRGPVSSMTVEAVITTR